MLRTESNRQPEILSPTVPATCTRAIAMFWLVAATAGCGVSHEEHDAVAKENAESKRRIDALQWDVHRLESEKQALLARINSLQNAPSALLADAQHHLNQSLFELVEVDITKLRGRALTAEEAQATSDLAAACVAKRNTVHRANEDAMAIAAAARRAKVNAATAKLTASVDEVEGITWYRQPALQECSLEPYIGTHPSREPWLRLVIRYSSSSPTYTLNSFLVFIDGTKSDMQEAEFKVDGVLYNWTAQVDTKLTRQNLALLKQVVASNKAIVRFYDRAGSHHDSTISAEQKTAIQNVLQTHEALDGVLPQ